MEVVIRGCTTRKPTYNKKQVHLPRMADHFQGGKNYGSTTQYAGSKR